jgi:hypothetical protein
VVIQGVVQVDGAIVSRVTGRAAEAAIDAENGKQLLDKPHGVESTESGYRKTCAGVGKVFC